MSLLEPTAGEMLDRLSILRLKMAAHKRRRKKYIGLAIEYRDIAHRIATQWGPGNEVTRRLYGRLDKANENLWDCEDKIRLPGKVTAFVMVAKRIAELNDKRNRLIREIDKAYGCETPVEEKIYSCTHSE
jgi:hypothetical protein